MSHEMSEAELRRASLAFAKAKAKLGAPLSRPQNMLLVKTIVALCPVCGSVELLATRAVDCFLSVTVTPTVH